MSEAMKYRVVIRSGVVAEFRLKRLAKRFVKLMQEASGYTDFDDAKVEGI